MPRAYSQDLRDRVIDAVVKGGESRRAAARRFGVSDASAVKWLQRFERLGDRGHAVLGGYRKSRIKAHREWLLAAIAAEPDLTLAALCDRLFAEHGLKTDTGSLSRFFASEGISFKKKRASQRAGSARRGAPAGELEALSGPARP
jgi:transposase